MDQATNWPSNQPTKQPTDQPRCNRLWDVLCCIVLYCESPLCLDFVGFFIWLGLWCRLRCSWDRGVLWWMVCWSAVFPWSVSLFRHFSCLFVCLCGLCLQFVRLWLCVVCSWSGMLIHVGCCVSHLLSFSRVCRLPSVWSAYCLWHLFLVTR